MRNQISGSSILIEWLQFMAQAGQEIHSHRVGGASGQKRESKNWEEWQEMDTEAGTF